MIVLLTKDEDKELALIGFKDYLRNKPELLDNLFIQTGLTHSDLKFFLDIYVLEEGRKSGEQVSDIFGKNKD